VYRLSIPADTGKSRLSYWKFERTESLMTKDAAGAPKEKYPGPEYEL
jgi:hypothetical protein